MSVVDYTQTTEDHSSVLLLVQQAGSHLTAKAFTKLYERLARVNSLRVKNQHRSISIRYKKFYPCENNAWGDFQAHRKVLGVICLAKCHHPDELPELYRLYEGIKAQYGNTLYDSRLVVFGLDPNETGSQAGTPDFARKLPEAARKLPEAVRKSPDIGRLAVPDIIKGKGVGTDSGAKKLNATSAAVDQNTDSQKTFRSTLNEPHNVNARNSMEKEPASKKVPSDVTEAAVPWDPLSAYSLLAADGGAGSITSGSGHLSNDGLDTRADRSASVNSQSSESSGSSSSYTRDAPPYVMFFLDPDDCPKLEGKVHDFMSSLFWVLESKRLDRSHERLDKLPMLCAPFERKDLIGVDTESRVYRKRCQGRLKKHLGDLCLLAGIPGEAMLHYQTAMETLKSCNDWLWLAAALEGLCACYVTVAAPTIDAANAAGLARNHSFNVASGSTAAKEVAKAKGGSHKNLLNGLDGGRERMRTLPEDIGEKYADAVSYYSKYRAAAVVEMECNVKACRVLASQKPLAAILFPD